MAAVGLVLVLLVVFAYGITLVTNSLAEERRRNGNPPRGRPGNDERPPSRVVYDCPSCGPGVVFIVGGDVSMLRAASGRYTSCMNCGTTVGPTRFIE